MAFKIDYQVVLEPMALSKYHDGYGDNIIEVCVNPTVEFLDERDELVEEFNRRFLEAQPKPAPAPAKGKKTDPDATKVWAKESADSAAAFNEWVTQTFAPAMNVWFAKLWSLGAEKWTAEDLEAIEKTDATLLARLKGWSMAMIQEHRTGQKKSLPKP